MPSDDAEREARVLRARIDDLADDEERERVIAEALRSARAGERVRIMAAATIVPGDPEEEAAIAEFAKRADQRTSVRLIDLFTRILDERDAARAERDENERCLGLANETNASALAANARLRATTEALHEAAQRFRDAVEDDNVTCRDNGLDGAQAVEDEWQAIEDALRAAREALDAKEPTDGE